MKISKRLKPLSTAQRSQAVNLLREKGRLAWRDVEKLMGWEGPVSVTHRVMARQLGITEGQLKHLLWRLDLREREKQARISESNARHIAFSTHFSRELGFSISLPAGWCVITDTQEVSRLAQTQLEYVRRTKPGKKPTRGWAYARTAEDGSIRPLTEVEEVEKAKREFDECVADAERYARLEQMTTGLFQAELPTGDDAAFMEVTKLRLHSPVTALQLYTFDKHPPEMVPWGSRPSTGMVVDGLLGVVYYFMMDTGDATQEQPVFFNVYLAERNEGWVLSCQCRYGDFYFKTFRTYKPIFKRIIGSFRRFRTA